MNPSERWCFRPCGACTRCARKGDFAKCSSCAGRHDPRGRWDPYDIDDKCRCTEGILQIRLQSGRMIQTKYKADPFAGKVVLEARNQDEEDWKSYLHDQREIYDDEDWDPVQFTDGTSTTNWMRDLRRGRGG